MTKILLHDLETTGLRPEIHGIHQHAFSIIIDGVVKESHCVDIQIFPSDKVVQEALDVSNKGLTEAIVRSNDNGRVFPYDFKKFLELRMSQYVNKFDKNDKFHLLGYNSVRFDNEHLRAFYEKCGDKYFGSWFWSDSLDAMVFASQKLMNVRHKMPNFQLRTVAKELGIEVDESKLHDAKYDLELTYKIYLKCQA